MLICIEKIQIDVELAIFDIKHIRQNLPRKNSDLLGQSFYLLSHRLMERLLLFEVMELWLVRKLRLQLLSLVNSQKSGLLRRRGGLGLLLFFLFFFYTGTLIYMLLHAVGFDAFLRKLEGRSILEAEF